MRTTGAKEWTVLVGIDREQVKDPETTTDALIHALEAYEPAIGTAGRIFGARFTVSAPTVRGALDQAVTVFRQAARQADVDQPNILELHAQEWSTFVAELERDRSLELVGVAEVAELLEVSKQRVTQLRHDSAFPEPWQELAAGPVWARAAVERFVETWNRRPGPKARRSDSERIRAGVRRALKDLGYSDEEIEAAVALTDNDLGLTSTERQRDFERA